MSRTGQSLLRVVHVMMAAVVPLCLYDEQDGAAPRMLDACAQHCLFSHRTALYLQKDVVC